MSPQSSKTHSSIFFIGLNAIRALSLIGLLLVFASSILVMVEDIKAVNRFTSAGHLSSSDNSTDTTDLLMDCDYDYIEGSTVPNQPAGAFWAVTNRLLIIAQVVFLILSELGWPMAFFDKFFPVLGTEFGVGALGVIQCLLGAAVLSHHVDEFALVSAFFLFAIGCLNILVGLIFRADAKKKRSMSSRDQEEGLPTASGPLGITTSTFASRGSGSISSTDKSGYGFGRQGEKAAGLKGFLLTKPLEALPNYTPKPNGGASRLPSFASSATAM